MLNTMQVSKWDDGSRYRSIPVYIWQREGSRLYSKVGKFILNFSGFIGIHLIFLSFITVIIIPWCLLKWHFFIYYLVQAQTQLLTNCINALRDDAWFPLCICDISIKQSQANTPRVVCRFQPIRMRRMWHHRKSIFRVNALTFELGISFILSFASFIMVDIHFFLCFMFWCFFSKFFSQ